MLKLTYFGTTKVPVEVEVIRPDQLVDKSAADVARLQVQHGNAPAPLGEFFHVEGDAGDGAIQIEGDLRRVKWIGAGMTAGDITIHGDVGMHLGAEMEGGTITVHGNVGDWVGAEMRGGRIHVHGNAGHLVGAAYRGSRYGMRGGVILVDGNAGNEVGATMRRGCIAVGGDAADFVGVSMIAGTVFVFGQPGLRTGAGMKRGSVVLHCPAEQLQLLPTFRPDGTYEPTWVRVFRRQLAAWGFPFPKQTDGAYRRYSGDLVALGKGEILHAVP